MASSLAIRLLGDLQVVHDDRAVALPASRKTRALLGYLVATGQPHRRERLCDLLWDGPDDPRAELRWSLSKLRPLLAADGVSLLRADPQQVEVDATAADIDLRRARALLAPGVAAATVDALRAAVPLLDGEFLAGLDLPGCPRFYQWHAGERESVAGLRAAVLQELVRRLAGEADEALAYARRLVAADPASEPGHAAVVRLLGSLGRVREAHDHYQYSRRLLADELGAPLSGELEKARPSLSSRAVGSTAASAGLRGPRAPALTGLGGRTAADPGAQPLVGRQDERTRLEGAIARAVAGQAARVVLLEGEPGIGKSRLLRHVEQGIVAAGGLALAARAFEAETIRPYGLWVDALRGLDLAGVPAGLRPDLAALLGSSGGGAGDRTRLFETIALLLQELLHGRPLMALLFDDLQWADDASCSLLHYVVRVLGPGTNCLVVCAARAGELEDCAAARRLVDSLRREGQLERLAVGSLSAGETAELVRAVAPALDGAAIHAESAGNPLFALELAQARAGGIDWIEGNLGSLIAAQLARLDPRAKEVVAFAAALGIPFSGELLAQVAGLEMPVLLTAVGELERHGLIRAAGVERYDFTHDLVRQAAYRGISPPRRRLLHLQIARTLAALVERDEALYAQLARHASAAEEHELAARAAAAAGERCLRLFAGGEAGAFADLGSRHLARMAPAPSRCRLAVALLRLEVLSTAGGGRRRRRSLPGRLERAIGEAQAAGLDQEVAAGFHLLSVLQQETGDVAGAAESTRRAAAAGRGADAATHARQLANTARCLADLETDIASARELSAAAAAELAPLGLEIAELHWGWGLLQRWDGEAEAAIGSLERALELARGAEDRWREYQCLGRLATLELERGGQGAGARCAELRGLAARLGEEAAPWAHTLTALAQSADGDEEALPRLEQALAGLRSVDDKSHLAQALNLAAGFHLQAGRWPASRACAEEALAAAETMRRGSEAALARALLAQAALAAGDPPTARRWLQAVLEDGIDTEQLSAPARAAVAGAAEACGLEVLRREKERTYAASHRRTDV